jgi:hypothetical protein|mmetsp:Transcript_85279/g.133249  ORF Transcript_85279/g.133249 Transcript_85279/m.133249 type:complete len:85 (+) Transcript_85279:582-836(+)
MEIIYYAVSLPKHFIVMEVRVQGRSIGVWTIYCASHSCLLPGLARLSQLDAHVGEEAHEYYLQSQFLPQVAILIFFRRNHKVFV